MQRRANFIGTSMRRKEDERVLHARTRYLDDIALPRMAHIAFVRSPIPHASFQKVDFSALMQDPEVIATLAGDEMARFSNSMPVLIAPEGCANPRVYPLAINKVRYIGEPVAAVVVNDKYNTEDAAERVQVEYNPLPVVSSTDEEPKQVGVRLYEEWGTNLAYRETVNRGDVEEAFRRAHGIVSEKFETNRQYGAAMEPRGELADFQDGFLTLYSSTQWPHFVRTLLARTLKHPENMIRVIAPDVGGGFGNRQDFYREEVVASYLAMKLHRPVKWVASRYEDMSSTVHARQQVHLAEMAFDREGRILGLRDRILADLGAFGPMSIGPQKITMVSMCGPYGIQNIRLDLECYVTNKVPVGAYRGFGQGEAVFVLERLIDMLAEELGIEPAEVRRRNLVTQFPHQSPLGSVIDSGDFLRMLQRAVEAMGLEEFRKMQREYLKQNRFIGIGLAFGLEGGGIGPSHFFDIQGVLYKGFETMRLRIDAEARVTVFTGLSPHGQGLVTTLCQVCADQLEIDPDSVTIVHGDTESCPYGFGTWGSRSAVLGATTLLKCVNILKDKMRRIAAHLLEAHADDVVFDSGRFCVKGIPQKAKTLKEIAEAAYFTAMPEQIGYGLEATVSHEPRGLTITSALHAAVVEVDPQTGKVSIVKYLVVHDCGKLINPMIVEGQVHGGVAQGIAGAMYEEIVYGQDGQLLTSTFMDYLVPTSVELPTIELIHLETPTPLNEFGIKGMGESGIIPPAPAIANAVSDALKGIGIKISKTPVTSHTLWQKISEAQTKEAKPLVRS